MFCFFIFYAPRPLSVEKFTRCSKIIFENVAHRHVTQQTNSKIEIMLRYLDTQQWALPVTAGTGRNYK